MCGDNEYCDCSTDYECRCEYGFSGGSGVCKGIIITITVIQNKVKWKRTYRKASLVPRPLFAGIHCLRIRKLFQ